MGEQALELLALADIAHVRDIAGYGRPFQLVGDHSLDPADAAVLAEHAELERSGVGGRLEGGIEPSAQQRPVVGMDGIGCTGADQLIGLVAEKVDDGRRKKPVDALRIDDHGRV